MTETYHAAPDDMWRLEEDITALAQINWRKDIERKLKNALVRNRRSSRARADGYPISTSGGGGGGGASTSTSVERAVVTNVDGHGIKDPLHEHTIRAQVLLRETAGLAAQLLGQLELIDRLTTDTPVTKEACELCGDASELVWGTVGGILSESHDLCRSRCYHFVRDNGGLPTVEQRAYFAERGKWRVRVAG